MTHSFGLFRALRFANSVIFVVAVGLALDHSMASALSRLTGEPHWSTADRALVVVDTTGDAAWNRANQHAVATWNRAATGTGLHLTWTAGTGECVPAPGRVVVCGASSASLDDGARLSRQGVTRIELGPDRDQAHVDVATVSVCADCRLSAQRRRVVATHELGHALGLPHIAREGSVMYPTGGPDAPDSIDVEDFRALYGHVDEVDRCGYFDARLGPLCF